MVIINCSFSLTACVSRSRWTPACSTSSLPDLLRKMRRSVCALCHGSTSPRRRVGSINPCATHNSGLFTFNRYYGRRNIPTTYLLTRILTTDDVSVLLLIRTCSRLVQCYYMRNSFHISHVRGIIIVIARSAPRCFINIYTSDIPPLF